MWDPQQYDVYADERSRPFHELLARVPAKGPRQVVDLGCGNGALTATLAQRWPAASVLGVDSSPEMLADAAGRELPGRLAFQLGGIESWQPGRALDVLVSNAALQWVPGHGDLLGRLVSWLAPGGWLAFQVPGNFGFPSHTILAALCRAPRWSDRLGGLAGRTAAVLEPAGYLGRLATLGCQVDAWETTYLHVRSGADPVLDWVRGSALRPVLAALGGDAADFEQEYAAQLRAAYPAQPYGTVFPFRRLFVVARRPA
ncbi:MAG TPA: trans-aconitate 2-methyltransferase [Mycobacteriales bacterium]|nr:trans-aconitate 2-methyltransferase [Mycobacteriales bacterium]